MAVNKLIKVVRSLTAPATISVKGYEYAIVSVRVKSITGNRTFGFYASSTTATTSSDRAVCYLNGNLITGNTVINTVGTHEFHIDVSQVSSLLVNWSNSADLVFDGEVVVSTSYHKMPESVKTVSKSTNYVNGGYSQVIFTDFKKQIDFEVDVLTEGATGYVRLESSIDGVTWTAHRFIDTYNALYAINSFVDVSLYKKIRGYVNCEDAPLYRVKFDSAAANIANIKIAVHDSYIDREIPYISNTGYFNYSPFKGYKYAMFDFAGTKMKDTSLRVNITTNDKADGSGSVIPFAVCTLDAKRISKNWFTPIVELAYELYGDVASGGFLIDLEKAIGRMSLAINPYNYLTGYTYEINYKVKLTNKKPVVDLHVFSDKKDYKILTLPSNELKKDHYNNDILEYGTGNSSFLRFYHNGYFGVRYDIAFTTDNIPSLKDGEQIQCAYLLPFSLTDRNAGVGSEVNPSRIVVFTTKGRVLHNFPARVSGNKPNSDLFKFDESTIYNKFKRFLPVNEKIKAGGLYKYFPVLSEYNYNQFDGRIAGTDGFVDYFNTGGIPAITDTPVLDMLIDNSLYPLYTLSHACMSKDAKMCLFGNYNNNPGAEPFVMATNNGGKTWHVKAYFAQTDYYPYQRGGKVDFSAITNVAGTYASNSLRLCRKRFNVPTNENKEPATPFIINEAEKSSITSIATQDGTVVVTLADNVDYDGYFPVVYFENVSAHSEWNYVCNTGFTEDGITNNGIFFRAEKIAPNQYKLYGDTGDAYQSDLLCRHIHAVNRTQNGFIISTGESYLDTGYQGGFLYYLEQTKRNGGDIYSPSLTYPIIRLTSSAIGVNRASGAYLFNDTNDPLLLYVADEGVYSVSKRDVTLPGRTTKLKNAVHGIYLGRLSDIDDQSKFDCVCELKRTLVSLVENMGHFAADGFHDAICISRDGKNWSIETLSDNHMINGTDSDGNIYFGDKVIVFN